MRKETNNLGSFFSKIGGNAKIITTAIIFSLAQNLFADGNFNYSTIGNKSENINNIGSGKSEKENYIDGSTVNIMSRKPAEKIYRDYVHQRDSAISLNMDDLNFKKMIEQKTKIVGKKGDVQSNFGGFSISIFKQSLKNNFHNINHEILKKIIKSQNIAKWNDMIDKSGKIDWIKIELYKDKIIDGFVEIAISEFIKKPLKKGLGELGLVASWSDFFVKGVFGEGISRSGNFFAKKYQSKIDQEKRVAELEEKKLQEIKENRQKYESRIENVATSISIFTSSELLDQFMISNINDSLINDIRIKDAYEKQVNEINKIKEMNEIEQRKKELALALEEEIKTTDSLPISSGYGYRMHKGLRQFHPAIDVIGKPKTPVKSMITGVVIKTGQNDSYGKYIEIETEDGDTRVLGAHFYKIFVKKGQHIPRGYIIGLVGKSGDATGYHTHYETKRIVNDKRILINPSICFQIANHREGTKKGLYVLLNKDHIIKTKESLENKDMPNSIIAGNPYAKKNVKSNVKNNNIAKKHTVSSIKNVNDIIDTITTLKAQEVKSVYGMLARRKTQKKLKKDTDLNKVAREICRDNGTTPDKVFLEQNIIIRPDTIKNYLNPDLLKL